MTANQAFESSQIETNSRGDTSAVNPLPDTNTEPLRQRPPAFEKDPVTGLHRQDYLCHVIDHCLAQGRKRKLRASLALLQLENFYEIRSWVGTPEADLLLSEIARLLKKTLPKRVLLCRCPNYEFAALLLAECSVNAGLITDMLKQALLSAVAQTLPRQLELKCGAGVAALELNIPAWPIVFARARHNLALSLRPRELPAHLNSISADTALNQLRSIEAQTELQLSFQALVNFSQDSLQHYEVRCLLSPNEESLPNYLLFETAARNARGEQLDRRILEQVISLLVVGSNGELRLLVNLSHNSLVSSDFLLWIKEKLTANPAIATQLILQISETAALVAQHHLSTFCEAMASMGIKISLSNFGCTPDPLRYLSLVPASFVKLDSTILSKIDINQESLGNLHAMISALHELQIKIIAPLLERPPMLPLLWQAGVDFLQGNCLHRPSPSMDFEFIESITVSFR
ncbi:MAG: GGDEF domain-containing protein [Gammaproteobacteria bacterium]|nr:GGDEF domain-containing protein [Gammaproteobacteria bacterium]